MLQWIRRSLWLKTLRQNYKNDLVRACMTRPNALWGSRGATYRLVTGNIMDFCFFYTGEKMNTAKSNDDTIQLSQTCTVENAVWSTAAINFVYIFFPVKYGACLQRTLVRRRTPWTGRLSSCITSFDDTKTANCITIKKIKRFHWETGIQRCFCWVVKLSGEYRKKPGIGSSRPSWDLSYNVCL